MQQLSLSALAREQLEIARASTSGRSASTVYGGHDHVLRQTLIAILGGRRLDEHANPGEATVHVLYGRVNLVAANNEWNGSPGDLIIVPDSTHSLEAVEDSVVLLTVAKTSEPHCLIRERTRSSFMTTTVEDNRQSLLSPEAKAVVEATASVVAEHAEQITARFYPRMFAEHPELLRVFNQGNQATGEQSRALAASVVAYAVQLIDPARAVVRARDATDRLQAHLARDPPGAVHDRRSPPARRGRRGARRRGDAGGRRRLERGVLAVRHPAHRRGGPAATSRPASTRREPLRPYRVVRRIEETARRHLPGAGTGRRRRACRRSPRPVRVGVRRPAGRAAAATPVHRLLHRRWGPGCRSPSAGSAASTAPRTARCRPTCTTSVQVGDVLEVSAPAGDFVVQPSDGPLLLASAGAGITTVLPIVEHIARTQPQPHGDRRPRRPDRAGPRAARHRAARRSADRRLHRLHLVRDRRPATTLDHARASWT